MPQVEVVEHFPLQLISYEDIQQIIDEAADMPLAWRTKVAAREWCKLTGHVHLALRDAYLLGVAARDKWLPRVESEWHRIEEKRSSKVVAEVRAAYVQFLDRVYGATYRHVLRRVPTAVYSSTGHFYLSRLLFYRHARVRDTEKSALQEVMELFYEGSGLRLELEFSWQPMEEHMGEDRPWRRRMNE